MCYTCYIMDLNIRNMDVTLVTRLKSEAALSGQTLRAHCVALLSQKLAVNTPGVEAQRSVGVIAPREVLATDRGKRGDSREYPPVEPMDVLSKAARLAPSAHPQHDPKTCRIYKCGMCAASKPNA
jgi:hypothetical protein